LPGGAPQPGQGTTRTRSRVVLIAGGVARTRRPLVAMPSRGTPRSRGCADACSTAPPEFRSRGVRSAASRPMPSPAAFKASSKRDIDTSARGTIAAETGRRSCIGEGRPVDLGQSCDQRAVMGAPKSQTVAETVRPIVPPHRRVRAPSSEMGGTHGASARARAVYLFMNTRPPLAAVERGGLCPAPLLRACALKTLGFRGLVT